VGTPTPIHQIAELGTSIWYDNLNRALLSSGELARMVERDGLRGMTSNPSIFEKAIGTGNDYDAQIKTLDKTLDDVGAFEHLAIKDIQDACDVFRPVFDRTGGVDGYVSLEVSPRLAQDGAGTIVEARRLFGAVARPNVMIKVPGTPECIPAIRELIGEGININTTLLFAVDAYLATADAYVGGLELFAKTGGDLRKVAGVASFFLSRIDTAVDKLVDDKHADPALKGKAAIANAKVAYAEYQKLIASPRWKALAGARPQRLLWASTGTKNPAYPKLMYVETLIGPDTVNTVPTETYNELRDHGEGHVGLTLTKDLDGARTTLAALEAAGISLKGVTDKLLVDGVAAFSKSFDTLLPVVAKKRAALQGDHP
jgi:transaldolase/glucose-6-phosphate isomerase